MPTGTLLAWLFAWDGVFPVLGSWDLKLTSGSLLLRGTFSSKIKALYELCLVQRTNGHRRKPEVSTKRSHSTWTKRFLMLVVPLQLVAKFSKAIWIRLRTVVFFVAIMLSFYAEFFFLDWRVAARLDQSHLPIHLAKNSAICGQPGEKYETQSRGRSGGWRFIPNKVIAHPKSLLWYIMIQLALMPSLPPPVDSPVTDSATTPVSRRNGKKWNESGKSSSSSHEGWARAKTAKSVSYQYNNNLKNFKNLLQKNLSTKWFV